MLGKANIRCTEGEDYETVYINIMSIVLGLEDNGLETW